MLIGAHVSPAGGPAKAVERGVERGCRAIQIFNQTPRAWQPTAYADERRRRLPRGAATSSRVDALLIHAVYLLNAASDDPEHPREVADLADARRCASGDALGARGVVLHPGSAKTGDVGRRSRAPAR